MNKVVSLSPSQIGRPGDFRAGQLDLIRRTVAKDTTNDEFDMFIEVCRRVGLDPFRKQIYCLVYNKDKPDKRKVAFITGIDGFRAVAARNGDYRPDEEEAQIAYDETLKDPAINPLGIERAIARAFKRDPKGDWYPVPGTAYWHEYAPIKEEWAYDQAAGKRQPTGKFELDRSGNWARMPRLMIAKCAEALALRKGWPEDLSGIYAPEEMERTLADDRAASEIVDEERETLRLAKVNANKAVLFLWVAGGKLESVPLGVIADRCMEHIAKADSATGLQWWSATNQEGMRQFWGMAPHEALEVKKALEAKMKELETA